MPDLPPRFTGPQRTKQYKNRQAKKRQDKRGLATNSARWRRLREIVLRGEPLCRHCKERGQVTPATQVDHIDNDSFNNSESNLQPLCASCHASKTAQERERDNGTFI